MSMSEDEIKRAFKEAMKEWLDEKFKEFGRWSFFSFLAAAFGAMIYLILTANGWHK